MSSSSATLQVFGIRHHGPGSAASLVAALTAFAPDAILVEGPPDADEMIPLLAHTDMRPPVALLVYNPKAPQQAVFYPFANFSPEYQALKFALERGILARFMDLLPSYRFGTLFPEDPPEPPLEPSPDSTSEPSETPPEIITPPEATLQDDPLGALGQAAGYEDGEQWWERMVERQHADAEVFTAILEAMHTLREAHRAENQDPDNLQREAYMRKIIRQTIKEGYTRIAVVCGAWHAPALILDAFPTATHDNALLKELKRTKTASTWIPWTHGRLTMASGYGAGIWSPGWYEHLWQTPMDDIIGTWLTKVAHLLREEDLIASTAQVIDAVRLSETLATLRGFAHAGLLELNEATLAVLCDANTKPLELISTKLIVGETIGQVPAEAPSVPLQQDFTKQRESLRMRLEATATTLNLDLRKPMHLERSHFLHRLDLLGVHWGKKEAVRGKSGTFHEVWVLAWSPEIEIILIERGIWGNTIADAASAYASHLAETDDTLPALTGLVQQVLWADLPDCLAKILVRMEARAALTGDVELLMQSLPALVDVHIYGNVRQTNIPMVSSVIESIVTRVNIGLQTACLLMNDEAASKLYPILLAFHGALRLLRHENYLEAWYHTLQTLVEDLRIPALLRGLGCRLLLDSHHFDMTQALQHIRLATSPANLPSQVATWLAGFLQGNSLILLHDHTLLRVIDEWLMTLTEDDFRATVPLLRRTLASFTPPERREIGRLVKQIYQNEENGRYIEPPLDEDRANQILPVLAQLLGVKP